MYIDLIISGFDTLTIQRNRIIYKNRVYRCLSNDKFTTISLPMKIRTAATKEPFIGELIKVALTVVRGEFNYQTWKNQSRGVLVIDKFERDYQGCMVKPSPERTFEEHIRWLDSTKG